MAIALDATSVIAAATSTSPATWSHTVGTGSNRVLKVDLQINSPAADPVSAVTYGGVSLTKITGASFIDTTNSVTISTWQLLNPPSGTNTISVTWSPGANVPLSGGATSLSGVSQASQPEASATNSGLTGTGGTNQPSVNVTTVANNAWVLGAVGVNDNSTMSAGASQTLAFQFNETATPFHAIAGSYRGPQTPAGAATVNFTGTVNADAWVIGAVSYAPAPPVNLAVPSNSFHPGAGPSNVGRFYQTPLDNNPHTVPGNPSALSVVADNEYRTVLNWTSGGPVGVNAEQTFRVERSLTSGTGYSEIGTAPAGTTYYLDLTASANTTYFYRVKARNYYGDSAYCTEQSATTLNPGSPWTAKIQGWVYGTNPYSPITDYTDGRTIDTLKPEYMTVAAGGVITEEDAGATYGTYAFSPANSWSVKSYSNRQFITVSAGYTNFHAIMGNSTNQTNGIVTLRTFCLNNGFTGVELDWEGYGSWTASDYATFKSFLTSLVNDFHSNGLQVGVVGPPIGDASVYSDLKQSLYQWKYEEIAPLVDYICVLAYDYEFDYGSGVPVQPIGWLQTIITWMINKVGWANRSKIVVGMPAYGYHGVTGSYTITLDAYKDSVGYTGFNTATRDASSQELTWTNAGSTYFYSDVVTINAKRKTIEDMGIVNVSVWYLGGNLWFSNRQEPVVSNTHQAAAANGIHPGATPQNIGRFMQSPLGFTALAATVTTTQTITGKSRITATTVQTITGKTRITQLGPFRTNLITNPSFETNTTGWQGYVSTLTQDATLSYIGSNSLKVVGTSAAVAFYNFTAVVGQVYTTQMRVKGVNGTSVYMLARNGGASGAFTLTGGWDFISYTFTPTSTDCSVEIHSNASSVTYNIDAVLLEANNAVNAYFDGSTSTASWTGTANASTSTMSGFIILGKSRIAIATPVTQLGKARVTAITSQTNLGKARITATSTQTITGKSRVAVTSAVTQLGRSRVTAITSQTNLGRARITATTTQTMLGKSRIAVTTTQTIQGKSRVTAVVPQTITGRSRITATTVQTILGRARITATATQTTLGKARITSTTIQTNLGKARIAVTTNQTTLGKSRITATTTQTILGKARVTATTGQTQPGKARITATSAQTTLGRARITTTTAQTALGRSRIAVITSQLQLGRSRITVSTAVIQLGRARITQTVSKTQLGLSRISVTTLQTILGRGRIATTRTTTGRGRITATTPQNITGQARIAMPGGTKPTILKSSGNATILTSRRQ